MAAIRFLNDFNSILGLIITVLYFYQFAYLLIGLFRRRWRDKHTPTKLHRYAAVISARNEAGVIGELVKSLKQQNYPSSLLDIYVVADNCTDQTAQVARAAGARVYRRFDHTAVGKGYALNFLFRRLQESGLDQQYDAYLVFDADNLVDANFVAEINRTFDQGEYDAITCYRNSKNFGQNWITASYSIWFLREARFVNAARMALGTNCAVSGTGFLISARLIKEKGGWPYHLLTEDIQFSAACAVEGRRIGYCEGAIIYDEQPATFRQSWDQRMRWSKGFYQVDSRYGLSLVKGIFRGGRHSLSCYDIFMTIVPGMLLTLISIATNIAMVMICLSVPTFLIKYIARTAWAFIWHSLVTFYKGMFCYALLTVLSEWKAIRATSFQKIAYLWIFPLFMLTYIPISILALFQKVEWKPIRHNSLAQLDAA